MPTPTPQLLKGFRDFYPPEMAFRTWLYRQFKTVAESFGFEEYEGPIVETLDLYAAKSGDELVKKQSFTFEDKTGQTLALRPEMTPSLARMIAQLAGSLTFPVKWFTFGPRWRYESPQRGRGREFFQWDVDILGLDNPESDAEIIGVAASAYQQLGLSPTEVRIKLNDRVYLQDRLVAIGIARDKITAIFKVIDKKAKITADDFNLRLMEAGLTLDQISKLRVILEDRAGFKQSEWLAKIIDLVESMGLGDYVEFDPTVVRGLDYYTRTVFEGWDTKGQFRSIWGGGRYDNLTQLVGGKQAVPGVGFAMGDLVLEEVMRVNHRYPQLSVNPATVLVTVFNRALYQSSVSVATNLRHAGVNTDLFSDPAVRLDKQLKYADKKGIPLVVILGPDEQAGAVATVKDLRQKTQQTIPLSELTNTLLKFTS